MSRRHRLLTPLRIGALVVAIIGFALAAFVYGPNTATSGGIDPVEVLTRDASYRLWTIFLSSVIAVILLLIDALRRIGGGE
jgi:hypothetical protein